MPTFLSLSSSDSLLHYKYFQMIRRVIWFLSRVNILMRDIDMEIMSIRLFVHMAVTSQYCADMIVHIIKLF